MDDLKFDKAVEPFAGQRGRYNQIPGLKDGTVRTVKARATLGKLPMEQKRELLAKAGYEIVQVEIWRRRVK